MWDLPGPGLEPISPALAGGFLTTAPPGKFKERFTDQIRKLFKMIKNSFFSSVANKYGTIGEWLNYGTMEE